MSVADDYKEFFTISSYLDTAIRRDYVNAKTEEQRASISYKDYIEILYNTNIEFMNRLAWFSIFITGRELSAEISNSELTTMLYPIIGSKTYVSYFNIKSSTPERNREVELSPIKSILDSIIPVGAIFIEPGSESYYVNIFMKFSPFLTPAPVVTNGFLELPLNFYFNTVVIERMYKRYTISNQHLNLMFGILPLTTVNTTGSNVAFTNSFDINKYLVKCEVYSFTDKNFSYDCTIVAPNPSKNIWSLILQYYNESGYNPMINILSVSDTTFIQFDRNLDVQIGDFNIPISESLLLYIQASIQIDQQLTLNKIVSKVTRRDSVISELTSIYSNYIINKAIYSLTPPFERTNFYVVTTRTPNATSYLDRNPEEFLKLPTYDPSDYYMIEGTSYIADVTNFLNTVLYSRYSTIDTQNRNGVRFKQYVEVNEYWRFLSGLDTVYNKKFNGTMISSVQLGFCVLFLLPFARSAQELGCAPNFMYIYLNCLFLEDLSYSNFNKYYVVPGIQFLYKMETVFQSNISGYYMRNFKLPLVLDGITMKPFFGFSSFNQALLYTTKNLSDTVKVFWNTEKGRKLFKDYIETSVRIRASIKTPPVTFDEKYFDNQSLEYIVDNCHYFILFYLRRTVGAIELSQIYAEILNDPNDVIKAYMNFDLPFLCYQVAVWLFFSTNGIRMSPTYVTRINIPLEVLLAIDNDVYAYYNKLEFNPELNLFFDNSMESLRGLDNQVSFSGEDIHEPIIYFRRVRRYLLTTLIFYFYKQVPLNAEDREMKKTAMKQT